MNISIVKETSTFFFFLLRERSLANMPELELIAFIPLRLEFFDLGHGGYKLWSIGWPCVV